MRGPESINVELDLKLFKVSGTWKPNEAERSAAWELYVELITRVAVVPLTGGLLREALTSNYLIFDQSRAILKASGPIVAEPRPEGQYNFGYLAVAYLNFTLRPFLAEWHPKLEDWENERPASRSRLDHEHSWSEAAAARAALSNVARESRAFVEILAQACNVPSLLNAVPSA